MLQKLLSAPALGAVLLILTAGLFVQNVDLGLASNLPQKVSTINDLSSKELFAYEQTQIEVVLAKAEAISTPSPKPTIQPKAETQAKVAEITLYKPQPVPQKATVEAPSEIESLIRKYAAEYGANPEVMLIIAKCESGMRADAVSASGAYKGMYQFVTSTWQSNRRAMGLDDNPALMLNAEEAIKTAAFKMGRDGYGAWPVCSQKAFRALALN